MSSHSSVAKKLSHKRVVVGVAQCRRAFCPCLWAIRPTYSPDRNPATSPCPPRLSSSKAYLNMIST